MELIMESIRFLIGFQEDIKLPRPHGTINHTVIRVSYKVSGDIKVPGPHGTINHTVIRVSIIGFQEDIKVPGPMEQLTIQSREFPIGFQEDINIIIVIVIVIKIIIIIIFIIFILACPDACCESGQTSGSCRVLP